MTQHDSEKFNLLHLTDLHAGMSTQDWLWPSLKHTFFDDLKRQMERVGPFDMVIFSGDMTQRGNRQDFDQFDTIFQEIWSVLSSSGVQPRLMLIPGNHDVARPDKFVAEHRVLKKWWDNPEVHNEFFSLTENDYRAAVEKMFHDYSEWVARNRSAFNIIGSTNGLLPGDQSDVLKKGNLSIGFIGLNSTWLQFDNANYLGKIHVDPRQLLRVTENDPDAWCKQNDINILVSHHPFDWLSMGSKELWLNEIAPPNRFDLHAFGHMHEPLTTSLTVNGSSARNSMQAPSLFGLAHYEDKVERIHGYTVLQFEKKQTESSLRAWPRRAHDLSGGGRKIGPDTKYNTDESNGSFVVFSKTLKSEELPLRVEDELGKVASTSLQTLTKQTDAEELLKRVSYTLPLAPAHSNIRHVERQAFIEALDDVRAGWVAADWGLGSDAFVSSVKKQRPQPNGRVYRLSLSELSHKDELFDLAKQKLGCSLDNFCEILSNAGPAYLILDDINLTDVSNSGENTPVNELEEVVRIILEYCSDLTVVLRSRKLPRSTSLGAVELKPIEEADVRSYVIDHERGGIELASEKNVAVLYRLSEGLPSRIDQLLKQLEVVPIEELLDADTDLSAPSSDVDEKISPGLNRTLEDLKTASDPVLQRSFNLLRVLTIFPQGEQLARIKRFFPTYSFFPNHANDLFDKALIEVTSVQRLDTTSAVSGVKTLIVPRLIRELVRDEMSHDERQRLNKRAAEVYFGSEWSYGIFRPPPAYRFSDPHCAASDISNASALILRLFKEARSNQEEDAMSRALGLANSYCGALRRGEHHRSCVAFCEEMSPLLEELDFPDKKDQLRSYYGRSLRMIGDSVQAKEVLLDLVDSELSNENRQQVLLELALCYQRLGADAEALKIANDAYKIDRHSGAGMQARSILIELDEKDPGRDQKLIDLEKRCRNLNFLAVANNIALLRSRETSDPKEIQNILKPVVTDARNNRDYYNRVRATVSLAKLSLDRGEDLKEAHLLQLVGCYHFLFNERFQNLFDNCHDALWKSFSLSDDQSNLLSLFRHSSLYWRLRDQQKKEVEYVKDLSRKLGETISGKISDLNKEAAYYKARSSTVGLIEQSG